MNCFFYNKTGNKYFSKVDALNDSQDVYLYYHDTFQKVKKIYSQQPYLQSPVLLHE